MFYHLQRGCLYWSKCSLLLFVSFTDNNTTTGERTRTVNYEAQSLWGTTFIQDFPRHCQGTVSSASRHYKSSAKRNLSQFLGAILPGDEHSPEASRGQEVSEQPRLSNHQVWCKVIWAVHKTRINSLLQKNHVSRLDSSGTFEKANMKLSKTHCRLKNNFQIHILIWIFKKKCLSLG